MTTANILDAARELIITSKQRSHPKQLHFPAKYHQRELLSQRILINCFPASADLSTVENAQLYRLPKVDEFFGDLDVADKLHYFDKFSSFDEKADVSWEDIASSSDILTLARDYFTR